MSVRKAWVAPQPRLNLGGTVLLVCQTRRGLVVGIGAGEPQFVKS